MKATRSLAAALSALLLFAACGETNEPVRQDAEASPDTTGESTPPAAETPSAPPESAEEETALVTWFARGDKLWPERRRVASTPGIGAAAVRALLEGPSSSGLSTAIPEGTELNELAIADGTARVDLSGTFDDGGGSLGIRMRLAQVVFTLTQFPSVKDVEFLLDGQPVETFSSEGLVLDSPQKRSDYEEHLPAISVESPLDGDTVSSTFDVTGTANVFEANVTIDVIGGSGEMLIETFTTATCGTGCRGTFKEKLELPAGTTGPITLKVYESSAEDGRPVNVVKISLTVE